MSLSRSPVRRTAAKTTFWDFLTFDRLLTTPLIHIVYWAGLGLVTLIGFFMIGAVVGTAIREKDIPGVLLAVGGIVAAGLVCTVMALLWRTTCEFYVAVFRISEDLRALRESTTGQPETLRGPGRPIV
jgi:hypothetical protein